MILENNIKGLVSVILPTHNRADFLKIAIESILKQSYQNFEIIVVADSCTDNTEDIVKNFVDDRIFFFKTPSNLGGAGARNLGLDHAKGEYIAFLDDDDEWLENKLIEQINIFENYEDVALVCCSFTMRSKYRDININQDKAITLERLLYKNICGSYSFCMTKKTFLGSLRINHLLNSCQDWDLWIKILTSTNLLCRSTDSILAIYNSHEQIRISNTKDKWIRSFVIINRQNWHLYSNEHKYFQMYLLSTKMNNLETSIIKRFLLALKSFKYLYKVKSELSLYNIMACFASLFDPKLRSYISGLMSKFIKKNI